MAPISPEDGVVAVTGVSGFTGGWVVQELVNAGYTVRACLRDGASWRGESAIRYLGGLGPAVEICEGCDLFVEGSYDAAFEGVTAVFHVAAVLGNSSSNQPLGAGNVADDTYRGGVVGTQNVLSSIEKSSTVRRLVYTSSLAAMNNSSGHWKESGAEWTEEDWASDVTKHSPNDPDAWSNTTTAYSKSKVDCERMVNAAAAASDGKWDAVTICPGRIVGPMLFDAQYGQWPQLIGDLCEGKSIDDTHWNLLDVRDLARAQRLAAESAVDHSASTGGPRYQMVTAGGQFYISSNVPGPREEVPGLVERIKVLFPDFTDVGEPGPSSNDHFISNNADCRKLQTVLGLEVTPTMVTIRDCIDSLLELDLIAPKRQQGGGVKL